MAFLILTLFAAVVSLAPVGGGAASNEISTTMVSRMCGGPQAADPETFDVNFVDSMETISQKVADSGFGISSSGDNASERAYGLGQCLNYLSNIDCRLCYAESRVKLPLCLPATSARVYLNGCFLRYGNYNFSQEAVDGPSSAYCEISKNVTQVVNFKEIASGFVQNLTIGAYRDRDFYKQGNVTIPNSGITVYGVAQCWRSLNRSGCTECLESARQSIVGCLPGSDGKALNVGCFLRYSLDPFFAKTVSSSGGSSSAHLAIALGTSFAAAMVIVAAVFLWVKRRYSMDDEFTYMDGSSEIFRMIAESSLSFKYNDLKKATNDFSLENKLGQGGFGSVFKGILHDGREIAVKRLFFNTAQWVDQFFNEVNLISQVQHKNLVRLLGCSVEGPESLLVYEYLRNTSLDNFLFDINKKNCLDWEKRFDILVGTAEGLAYLHEGSDVRIIHRDIKASNVLLDERLKPKIADFGLARYFAEGQSHLSTGIAGTIGYMAPEYVIHGQLTEKADVYSYGVLVAEVLSGRKNTNSVSSSAEGHSLVSQIWELFNSNNLIEMLDRDLQGQCSEEHVLKVFQVGLLCTQASPNLRPPMKKIVELLTAKTGDLPLPSEPPFINIKGMEFGSYEYEISNGFSSFARPAASINQLSVSIMQAR
ncbi:cysteine-rich receptor-like protein kinase 2 [Malania oleifera]|uniref:cysteine-rich receptor-like protein kinase 2 n=1 Tax=Malania oleifera TaxID=397392 RepID=UPI0025AE63D4|nr:cysteine-rich receptor-like protein kinase 2 [Malania oleifera]